MGQRKREGMRRLARITRALADGKSAAARRGWRAIGLAAFAAAVLCGLGTSCRRAPDGNQTTIDVHLQDGEGKPLTLYEMRANTGTVTIARLSLDNDGGGQFRFTTDSLSLFVLQTEPAMDPVVLFPTVGDRLDLTADYADLVGTAHLRDADGRILDSLHILPFQKMHRDMERAQHATADYWADVRYLPDAQRIYDSIIQHLDYNYRMQKTESLRLAAQYPHTLIPIYLAQLQVGPRPLFDPRDSLDFRLLNDWAERLQRELPGNPHTTRFAYNLDHIGRLQRLQASHQRQPQPRQPDC